MAEKYECDLCHQVFDEWNIYRRVDIQIRYSKLKMKTLVWQGTNRKVREPWPERYDKNPIKDKDYCETCFKAIFGAFDEVGKVFKGGQ